MKKDVLFLVDRHSFPVKCPELDDFKTLTSSYEHFDIDVDNPTVFFQQALEMTESYELIVPVTRNFYIRDRLRAEGVNLIVSL